jgi:two-component system, NarL family, nitrate/nitrite response regulator NarL
LRILVAEDYEAVRKGVCAILRARSDIEVCGEADNGKEAVQKASALRPDLIILDLTIPMLSGFEAAREIRKTLPDVPILILSMHESKLLIEEAKKLGVQGICDQERDCQDAVARRGYPSAQSNFLC